MKYEIKKSREQGEDVEKIEGEDKWKIEGGEVERRGK